MIFPGHSETRHVLGDAVILVVACHFKDQGSEGILLADHQASFVRPEFLFIATDVAFELFFVLLFQIGEYAGAFLSDSGYGVGVIDNGCGIFFYAVSIFAPLDDV